jgi:hypothetical protein
MEKFTVKEQKAIQKVFSGTDVNAVKDYLDKGIDPNEIKTLKFGNIYDENNPYTLYDLVLHVQVWYLNFINETKKHKEQQGSLEIVKLVTPLVKSACPLEGKMSYTWRALPRSFDRLDLGKSNQYKKPGMYDVLINAMLETGYDFADDKDIFRSIGMFGLETAKKVIEITGVDDGASVFSAAENHNTELAEFLLGKGISPNKPFQFSDGNMTTALHEAIRFKDKALVKMLLDAGADTKAKNEYLEDCQEWAKSMENQDIIMLVNEYKK